MRITGQVRTVILPLAAFALFLLLFWKPFLPFACALLLASVLQKPHRALMDTPLGRAFRRGGQRRGSTVWAALLVIGCTVVGGVLTAFAVSAILDETSRLFGWFGAYLPTVTQAISDLVSHIADVFAALARRFSGSTDLADRVKHTLVDALPSVLSALLSRLTAAAADTVSAVMGALPRILLFFAVFLIAAIGMTAEYDGITERLSCLIPTAVRHSFNSFKKTAGSITKGVLRAYLILSVLTYGILALGFRILGVAFPLGAAALCLFLDLLPVIGVGTVLLPWALASFRGGRIAFACGLLLLYLFVSIVKRVLEGRLVGKSIGVHPLVVLFSLYAGGLLFGFYGLLSAPFAAAVVCRWCRSGYEKNTSRP